MDSSLVVNDLHLDTTLKNVAHNPDKQAPFEFYIFHDLLGQQSVDKLRDDVNSSVKLSPKDNDLYKFKQSKDLKSQIPEKKLTPTIKSFVDVLLDKIKSKLEKESGLELSDQKFDVTVSRYDRGNYLLCHNDDMKDPTKQQARALAFVYYLTSRPWTKDDGGALILYNSDSSGEPVEINNYVHPKPNTLVVFRTSSVSWHSVQEVFCKDDCRLSINGWFHLANPPTINSESSRIIEPSPYEFLKPVPLDNRMETFFKDCVNSQYLMEKTCYLVRRKFKRNSEINLPHFLVEEKFQAISKALKEAAKSDDNLQLVGPYNKRNYKRIKVDNLPQICQDLFDAFRSELFFMLLSRLTGLDLQPPHLVHEKQMEDESSEDEDDDDDDSEDDEDEQKGEEEVAPQTEDCDDHEDEEIDETQTFDANLSNNEGGIKNDKEKKDSETTSSSDNVVLTKKTSKRKRQCDPLSRLEFRHLEAGSYTLIHDHGFELGERSALDVILHFNHDFEVVLDHGGYLSYLDVSDDNDPSDLDCELLTVEPKSNCLSLVYRSDEGTCRFMKYITKEHKSDFQDLYCVYYERSDDLPNQIESNKKMKSEDTTIEGASSDCI